MNLETDRLEFLAKLLFHYHDALVRNCWTKNIFTTAIKQFWGKLFKMYSYLLGQFI